MLPVLQYVVVSLSRIGYEVFDGFWEVSARTQKDNGLALGALTQLGLIGPLEEERTCKL